MLKARDKTVRVDYIARGTVMDGRGGRRNIAGRETLASERQHANLDDILNHGRPDVAANENLHFITFFCAEKGRSKRRLTMHDSS